MKLWINYLSLFRSLFLSVQFPALQNGYNNSHIMEVWWELSEVIT